MREVFVVVILAVFAMGVIGCLPQKKQETPKAVVDTVVTVDSLKAKLVPTNLAPAKDTTKAVVAPKAVAKKKK